MPRKFQIKRGKEEEVGILAEGELGFTLDTKELFIGTGADNVKYTRYGEYEAHKEDTQKHLTQEKTAFWNAGVTTAENALSMAQEALKKALANEVRIAALEMALYSNVVENPFSMSFGNLSSIQIVKGIWNQQGQRIEC